MKARGECQSESKEKNEKWVWGKKEYGVAVNVSRKQWGRIF